MVQVVPQFQINQIFNQIPDAATNALRALVIGPDYAVRKYSNNKAAVSLGAFAGADLAVNWPGRLTGEVVDQAFTSVNMDQAACVYYTSGAGVQSGGTSINRLTGSVVKWADNPGFARTAGIPGDVKVGDFVRISDLSLGVPDVQVSTVNALIADVVAAVIGTATAIAGNSGSPTVASGGTYTGTTNTTYIVTVTRGGSIASGNAAQITVSTSTGVDASGPHYVTTATPIVIGSLGVTVTITSASVLTLGDRWSIACTAASAGAIHGLELANQIITNLRGIDLKVEVGMIANISVPKNRAGHAPLVNWSQTATQITLKAGMLVQDARFAGVDLTVVSGTGYASYRALRTATANTVKDISVAADVLASFGGLDDPDSGMSYGLYRALSNAAGTVVKAISVSSDDLVGYQAALAKLREREDFHRIVPLTFDTAIIDACLSTATSRSGETVGRWATVMGCLNLTTTKSIATGLATAIDDPATGGTQYTVIHDASGHFLTNGVVPGDTLRYAYTTDGFGGTSYTSYTVDSVISNEDVRLVAGPSAAVTIASRYEIWRTLSTTEQADDWGVRAQARTNHRFTVAFPPAPARGGVSVPGYYLACSLAALRGASAPHQGLTNAAVLDWDDMTQASQTFGDLLDTLANYGAYIVTQSPEGVIYIRKQLTTDLSDVNHAEDSATTNFDSISYVFKNRFAAKVGRSNVVPSNLDGLRAEALATINFLKTAGFTTELGAQINDDPADATANRLDYLRAHALLKDTVVAQARLNTPLPLNNGVFNLVIG